MRTRIQYVKDGKQYVTNYPTVTFDLYPWLRFLVNRDIEQFTVDLIFDDYDNE